MFRANFWVVLLVALGLASIARAENAPAQVPAGGHHALTRDDAEAFFDGIMSQRLERDDIAGAAVAIVKDGRVLLEKGYGYADVANKIPVSAQNTVFGVGSISKLFVGTAVMQLVERGKLNLDTDVSKYLDFKLERRFPEPITLRRLLTHTAGFEEFGKDDIERLDAPSKLGPFLASHQPRQIFHPGTRIAYSNYGVSLAGYIVEHVSHEAFADYIARHIYAPLGMTHSTFAAPLPPRLAALVSKEYPRASQPPHPLEYGTRRPAGGMYATTDDITHFMLAHLQGGAFAGERILSPAGVQTMHTIQWRGRAGSPGIGINFYQVVGNGRFAIAHGGDLICQHSELWLIPSEHFGLFVVFNSSGADWTRIRANIWKEVLNRYFPSTAAPVKASAAGKADIAKVTGTYLTTRRAQTSILSISSFVTPVDVRANADGTISMDGIVDDGGVARHFTPTGNLLFQDSDGNILAFLRDRQGDASAVIYDGVSEFERERGLANGHVQVLLLLAAMVTLLLSIILWPVTMLVRRYYGVSSPAEGLGLGWIRAAACAAIAMGAMLIAYLFELATFQLEILSSAMDPYIRIYQLLALGVIAGGLYGLWTTVRVWMHRKGSMAARLCLTAMTLALVVLSIFVVRYHMLAIMLNY